MAKKMYYNEDEAAEKLGGSEELKRLTDEGKIQSYRDGDKNMYKADQIDSLSGGGQEEEGQEEEIELAPAEEEGPRGEEPGADLSQADEEKPTDKEDTVISAEGVSIFDADDLDIEPADPMAKTQVAPSMEDQVAIEGAGSGSGLLDLTRESDETSLGADVLEHIEEEGPEEQPYEEVGEEIAAPQPAGRPAAAPVEQVVYAEELTASSGLFQALAGVCAVAAVLFVPVALAAMMSVLPGYLEWMAGNTIVILACLIALSGIAGFVGWFLAKSAVDRQSAMRR